MSTEKQDLEYSLRVLMVDVGRWMHQRGYIAGSDGNLSARLGAERLLVTPAGAPKGALAPADLVVTWLDGSPCSRTERPSTELALHVAAYRQRPELGAIVHAHPPAVVAHSLVGISLSPAVLPESILNKGGVATVEYRLPGSSLLAEEVAAALRENDTVVMERHGTVTVGSDLASAYRRLESLEHTAKTLLMARAIGQVEPLPEREVERLRELSVKRKAERLS